MASTKQSPAFSVAKKIVSSLEQEGLLDVSRVDRFLESLANGKLREGDWKLAIEKVERTPRKSKKKR